MELGARDATPKPIDKRTSVNKENAKWQIDPVLPPLPPPPPKDRVGQL